MVGRLTLAVQAETQYVPSSPCLVSDVSQSISASETRSTHTFEFLFGGINHKLWLTEART